MSRTIEKYEIESEIGHGGMATVFRARDTKLDRLVALKVLHPHLRGSAEAKARFRREAQGVARLRHPRILEIYDYSGEDSEESYIATELLTGPTLRKLGEQHLDMPAEVAACVAIEICRALTAAHEKGIVHRDVKPENILLHEARCLKLTDFGIADMVDSQTMTATGQILGSPGHMAPEQVEGRDCDARTDLFALGTVLYFLACARLPFTGRNPHQVLKRIVDGEYADPLRINPAIGRELAGIIVRCLEGSPDRRYASAAELERALRTFVGRIGIEDPEAALAAYLGDPEGQTSATRASIVKAYTELGIKARDAGDVPRAMDAFNRVLAIDGDNERVLALARSIGAARRRRSVVVIAAAVVALAVASGVGWAIAPTSSAMMFASTEGDEAVARPAIVERAAPPGATASLGEDGEEEPPAITERDPGAERDPSADVRGSSEVAGELSEARVEGEGVEGPDDDLGDPDDSGDPDPVRAPTRSGEGRDPRPRTERPEDSDPSQRRVVEFNVYPAAASIGVDGAPPRPYGPSWRQTEPLPLGSHTFTITHPQFESRTVTLILRAGAGNQVLNERLEQYRPARLIVRTNVPAGVVVADGLARGRANGSFQVPMSQLESDLSVTVSADGYRPVTTHAHLIAGRDTTEEVTLEPASP